ncbi:hypothetical protein MMC19_006672 [Ptychographa xylographoides]|nr:hypothetical protein [Ptychographa xylographoides]
MDDAGTDITDINSVEAEMVELGAGASVKLLLEEEGAGEDDDDEETETGAALVDTGLVVDDGAGTTEDTEAGPVGVSPTRTQPDLAVMAAGQETFSQLTLVYLVSIDPDPADREDSAVELTLDCRRL